MKFSKGMNFTAGKFTLYYISLYNVFPLGSMDATGTPVYEGTLGHF
jgi:hypothetical protein